MSQTRIKVQIEDLSDEALDRQESLCLHILRHELGGHVASQTYFRLCEVRAAMFERVRS